MSLGAFFNWLILTAVSNIIFSGTLCLKNLFWFSMFKSSIEHYFSNLCCLTLQRDKKKHPHNFLIISCAILDVKLWIQHDCQHQVIITMDPVKINSLRQKHFSHLNTNFRGLRLCFPLRQGAFGWTWKLRPQSFVSMASFSVAVNTIYEVRS